MKNRQNFQISDFLFSNIQLHSKQFSPFHAEKLIEISSNLSPNPNIFKLMANFIKSSKYSSFPSSQFLFDSFIKLLSTSCDSHHSKSRLKELEMINKTMINLIIDIEVSNSLPQNILSLVFPVKKKFEDIINRIWVANEDQDINPLERTLLKVLLSLEDQDFLMIINSGNMKEKIQRKTFSLLTIFKETKAFDKKKETKLIFTLIFMGKFYSISEDTPENLNEISNLTLRFLKKLLKSNKFGFKTIGLLNLILSLNSFTNKPSDFKNFDKIDIPSLVRLLLDTILETIEKQPTHGKFLKLFKFLESYLQQLKHDKIKVELIEVFLAFYFKFRLLSTKTLNNVKEMHNEKRDSFSKNPSKSLIQAGESFRGIFQEDSNKNYLKMFKGFKDLILGLIIKGFELNITTSNGNKEDNSMNNKECSTPEVNFMMVFSKNYLNKMLSIESSSIETTGNSDTLQIIGPLGKGQETIEEINVFACLKGILKRSESQEFRCFLFETINSKLKMMKFKGNSRQQNSIFRMLFKFNVKAALMILDIDVYKKVIFDLFSRYEDIQDEEMKSYILGLARHTIAKNYDKTKVAYIISQESIRFCKSIVDLDFLNEKVASIKNVSSSFPMFEILSVSTEKFAQLKGNYVSDPALLKQFFNVWFYVMLFEKDFEAQLKHQLKIFAFFTPNLIEITNKGFSNQIIANDLASNNKLIERFHRNFKHKLRDQYPEQRPKIKNLSLGEMVYCLAISSVTSYKIQVFLEDQQRFHSNFPDTSFIEWILCYIRDNNLNQTQNLKFVIETIVIDKSRKYLEVLKNSNRSTENIQLISKDFRFLVQGACSINRLLLKRCEGLLREYIVNFPELVFQQENLIAIAETLNILYKKVKSEFESISSILKAEFLYEKIVLPNNHKDLGNSLLFLMGILLQLILRGHFIAHKQLVRSVMFIINHKNKGSNSLEFGYKFLRFLTINFKFHNVNCYDQNNNLLYNFSWLIDKPGFNKRLESIELKDYLDESIKVLMALPPLSVEITLDFKSVLSSIDNLTTNELEGLYEDKPTKHKQLKNYEMTAEIYEEISLIQLNLFVIHLTLSSRSILPDILNNKTLLSFISPKLLSLNLSLEKKPRIVFRKLEEFKESLYTDLFDHLLHIKSIIKKSPHESLIIFQNLLEISKVFCLPKVFKFIVQHILPSCYLTKSTNFDDRFFFTLFEQLAYIIIQINRFTNIRNEDKTTSADIFSIHSDFFKCITKLELLDFSNKPSKIWQNSYSPRNSVYLPFKPGIFSFSLLNYRVSRSLKLEFCDKAFKILVKSLSEHMNVFLAKKSDVRRLLAVLSLPFNFDKRSIEQMTLSSICYTLINNLEFYQVMKFQNEKFQTFTKEELRMFLVKSLNFGLMYFAKSGLQFHEDIYDKKSNLKQCGKKLDLFLKTCRYLQKEQIANESTELFTSYQTKKLILSSKKQEYYYLKQTRKNINKTLSPLVSYPNTYKYGFSFIKTNMSKTKKLNLDLLRKSLVLLISNDIDRLKGFNCIHLLNFKSEFSMEDKFFSDSETLTYISSLAAINVNLATSFFFRFRFAISNETRAVEILSEKIAENPIFYQQFNHLLDFYILKQISSSPNANFDLIEIFYWRIPHIQMLLKYISSDYEKLPLLQIFFTKTLKRLNGEQLLYYLPQIFQATETNSGLLIQKFLVDFSMTSQLFSHQLIWKSKVEMKIEDKKPGMPTNMLRVQESALKLPGKIYRNMSPEEKSFFIRVNGFFDQVTAISGVLIPSMDKKKKKEIIKEKLLLIKIPNEIIYLTSNPKYKVVGINLDSGAPMQSHARVPILVSFYCKRFEGPDQYFQKFIRTTSHSGNENEEEFTNVLLDDSLLEEEIETLHINELHISINPKLIPKEPNNGDPFSKNSLIKSKEISNSADNYLQREVSHSIKKFDKKSHSHKEKDKESSVHLTENDDIVHKNRSSQEKPTKKFTSSLKNDTIGDMFRPNKKSIESSLLVSDKAQSMESVGCIFKVFDDIRQDNLALQIIRLFKEIFKKVGLDLFLYPYRTISNRSGKEGDIGGIIECVPNSISRDQMGKTHKCNLFEYFIGKFGQADSPEFQIARDNFIKSQAAYSVVSYILQIKDRHNGNILIDETGHLVHIDFGFIFDISPAHNMRFESADFKLTMEMIQIMGGSYQSEEFNYYTDLTVKAFLMIRKYHEHIFNLIKLIFKSGLKCFRPNSLEHLKQRFMLNKNDLAAAKSMKAIISQSYDKFTTNFYDKIQKFQNDIHY